jgi:hypothetical protein
LEQPIGVNVATQVEKDLHRAEREAHRAQKRFGPVPVKIIDPNDPIDCACVIHGNGYDWKYVDRLYSMLCRHLTGTVRLHVYTEPTRPVPVHMIRHDLTEWPGVSGRKRSWWYKMQLFNSTHYSGQLLYFDLDVVIVDNIDWITQLSPMFFWTVKDFRSLWRPELFNINSSVMYWNTTMWDKIWQEFSQHSSRIRMVHQHGGDQEYLNKVIPAQKRQFLDERRVVSWRWTALDGGMNFKNRTYYKPGSGTLISPGNSILVFHGDPKPHEINDTVIKNHWV